MHTPLALIVLRHGETFIKGRNRRNFEQVLEQNTSRALASLGRHSLERAQGRLYVRVPATQLSTALRRLERVFGFSSISPAMPLEPDVRSLPSAALEATRELLRDGLPKSFKVQSKRSDKRFALTSPEINRRVGAAIFTELNIPVDVHHPEVVIGVEIGTQSSFLYIDRLQGAGGLPTGVSGRVLLLLSGGIDSPVAGHLMQKRGCRVRAVYFHSPPHTSERALDKVTQLAERLAPAQGAVHLQVVRFGAIQEHIRDGAAPELLVVLYRRAMMRVANQLAEMTRCKAIATGESLGQVASQTLENLHCIEAASALPVLRPLLTFDKQETILLARQIGTFDISVQPYPDCCSLFIPKHPATRVALRRAEHAERKLALGPLIEQAVAESEQMTFTGE